MPHATPRQRRAWLRWHGANGSNVAATCRHFGIARSTFYLWLRRSQEAPSQPLRRKRRRSRKGPRLDESHQRVLDLTIQHPRWGARRVRAALQGGPDPVPSESTIGRWLRAIVRKCPVCGGEDGVHKELLHAADRDIRRMRDPHGTAERHMRAVMAELRSNLERSEFCHCGVPLAWGCEHSAPNPPAGLRAIPDRQADMDRHVARP